MNSKQVACPFVIRRLAAADAECFRALRLAGLRDCPEAFGASYEDEAIKPVGWFADRLEANLVFGACQDLSILVAIAGLRLQPGKSSHKAQLWGMFVAQEARRRGLATALLAQLISHAACAIEEIRLSVVNANAEAVRLYANAGFGVYGLESRALKIDGRYYDELLMSLPLRPAG
jgi:ribosomal protein S18 acetylase RimI-like enzyme